MCVNYRPTGRKDIEGFFKAIVAEGLTWRDETWKDYAAPILRAAAGGERIVDLAGYGIVPKRHIPEGVKKFDTMNARAETVAEKRSFSPAWKKSQLCLVPMLGFFEPCYESGKPIRWEIGMADGAPFAVAGLWREWNEPDGTKTLAFAQLTVNAEEHPLMQRFYKPGDEKRALVVVPPDEYDFWLNCDNPEVARSFFRLYPAEMMTSREAPIPPRKSQTAVE
jgi:putative SOS response-associated peptidase YedK